MDIFNRFRILFILLTLVVSLQAEYSWSDEPVSFKNQIAPLLHRHCAACHQQKKMEGGYRVDSYEHLLLRGDSGERGIVPENLMQSEVWQRVTATDETIRMPQDREPLAKEHIALIQRWIEQGAKFDAADTAAPLVSILPPVEHRPAPEKYPTRFPVTALAFDATGERLFSSGYHELLEWNVKQKTLQRRIGNLPQRIQAIACSPDQKFIAVAGGEPGLSGEVRIVNFATGKIEQVLASSADVTNAVAWSPQGNWLATAGADQPLRIFRTADWQQEHAFQSHSDWVFSLAWDAAGERLVSASRDQTAKVFHVAKRELQQTYWGHDSAVRGAVFHPEGKELFSAGDDREFHRWQLSEGKKLREVNMSASGLAVVGGVNRIFVPQQNGRVSHFNLDGKLAREFTGLTQPALSLAVHNDLQLLVAGSSDGEVVVWRYKESEPLQRFLAIPQQTP
jgi:Planctomycete cytochrome C/Anaphase-promoting complex subunit 4 WD40 domain/WD domain, G-beta repeat